MTRVIRVNYAKTARLLQLEFDDGTVGELSAEYLRVNSPSAEVRGHGSESPTLVAGKACVDINTVRPVGHYALQLLFDDGHDSGIYTWAYLHTPTIEYEQRWQAYLKAMHTAGLSRHPEQQVVRLIP